MSLLRLFKRSAVIIHRTQTGSDSKMGQATWVEGESVPVKCHVEPAQGLRFEAESADRPEARATHRGYLPPDTQITTRDRLVLDDQSFEVEGAPRRHFNPRTGIFSHVEVDLVVHA